jgi:hypothetical protein
LTSEEYERILSKIPLDNSQIILRMSFPTAGSAGLRTIYTWNMTENKKKVHYLRRGKEHCVLFNIPYVKNLLAAGNLQPDTSVKFEIMYPIKT